MQRVFTGKKRSELDDLAKQFYRNLIDVSLEVLSTVGLKKEQISEKFEIVKDETYHKIATEKKPFLLYASHQCNWEWLAMVIGIQLVPVDPIYKVLRNERADKLMYDIRSRFGNRPIPAPRAGKMLRKAEGFRGGGIVADQSPTRQNKGKVWTNFLGQETAFYQGIFVLPYLTQRPAYYISVSRVSRGKYKARFMSISEPPYQKNDFTILHKYVQFSEAAILENPENWLWSHNRWKYPRATNEELLNFPS